MKDVLGVESDNQMHRTHLILFMLLNAQESYTMMSVTENAF